MAGNCPINGYDITIQSGFMHIFNKKGLFLWVAGATLQWMAMAGVAADSRQAVAAPAMHSPAVTERDIKVIIDVSGSMKKNDPDNHRSKAVQLFSEILPAHLTAGIWTFAAEVNMLVKHDQVDQAWKDSAFKKADKIHSYGLYTNIEKALKVASKSLSKGNSRKEQHIILLTDGYVDISKNSGINADSRSRVIDELLPRFQENHIIVHTIALSQHADHELLKTLSHKTAGQYTVIEKASDLDRYFFKLFQATTKPDTVPLKNNRFAIDQSVNDMTVVLFNSEYASELTTPGGEIWSTEKHPSNVKWVKSDTYEIITVSKPMVGSWSVNAPVDPDNKIMVVTNLRLHVNKLPALLMPDEVLNIEAFMTEDEKIITKDQFINLLYVKTLVKKKNSLRRITIDTRYQGDGIFRADAGMDGLEDQCVLLITAKSPTFTREYRHEFSVVVDPVIVESRLVDNKQFTLMAYIDDRVIDKAHFSLTLQDEHGTKSFESNGVNWKLDLPSSYSGKKLTLHVTATMHNQKQFNQNIIHKLPEIKLTQVDNHHHEKPKEAAEKPVEEPVKLDDHAQEPVVNMTEDGDSLNWIIVTIAVILANIILGFGGFYIYKKIFKSRHSDDFLLLDTDDSGTDGHVNSESEDVENIAGLEDIEDMDDIESVVPEAKNTSGTA